MKNKAFWKFAIQTSISVLEDHPNRHIAIHSNNCLPGTHIDDCRGRHHHRDTFVHHHRASDNRSLRRALQQNSISSQRAVEPHTQCTERLPRHRGRQGYVARRAGKAAEGEAGQPECQQAHPDGRGADLLREDGCTRQQGKALHGSRFRSAGAG